MKRILCFVLSLSLLMVPALAADLDEVDYYSSPVVLSENASLLDYSVMPLDLSSSESGWLQGIYQTLVNSTYLNSPSILGNLRNIASDVVSISSSSSSIESDVGDLRSGLVGNSNSVLWYAREIYNDTSELHNIYLSASSSALSLDEINDAIQNDTDSLKELLASIWSDTDSLVTTAADLLSVSNDILTQETSSATHLYNLRTQLLNSFTVSYKRLGDGSQVDMPAPMRTWIGQTALQLGWDGVSTLTNSRTLYSRVRQLQEVLASDDDLALANSQKANREEIEDSFLTGSSGDTSLGASDFGALSDVGGTIKDSISLNGQSSISDFTTGLSDANTSGQRWFSESTKNALDTVSSSASYDLRSDPYNMSGWQDRYAWLEGDS